MFGRGSGPEDGHGEIQTSNSFVVFFCWLCQDVRNVVFGFLVEAYNIIMHDLTVEIVLVEGIFKSSFREKDESESGSIRPRC